MLFCFCVFFILFVFAIFYLNYLITHYVLLVSISNFHHLIILIFYFIDICVSLIHCKTALVTTSFGDISFGGILKLQWWLQKEILTVVKLDIMTSCRKTCKYWPHYLFNIKPFRYSTIAMTHNVRLKPLRIVRTCDT